jgi:hypothetical protein
VESELAHPGGLLLPVGHDSLTRGVARAAVPGSVRALALGGAYVVGPRDGRTVYFRRNRLLVHAVSVRTISRSAADTATDPVLAENTIRSGQTAWWYSLRMPPSRCRCRMSIRVAAA